MNSIKRHWALILSVWLATVLGWQSTYAQQYTLAFSSVDSPNANWYIAKERQLYKKYGLDVELILFLPRRRLSPRWSPVRLPSAIFPAGRLRMLPSVVRAWWRWAASSIRCHTN